MATLDEVLTAQKLNSVLRAPKRKHRLIKSERLLRPARAVRGFVTRIMSTTPTLNIALCNNTSSASVYAYITGLDINRGYSVFVLQADGATGYWPTSPSQTLQPLQSNCAIALGAPGTTRTVTIPQIAGGRIWFSVGTPLTFLLNPGPALVEPSSTNPSDPNYNIYWSFAEFTFNQAGIFANISLVDFASLPIGLKLESNTSGTQEVIGLPADGLKRVVEGLRVQDAKDGAGWTQLIINDPATGEPLRVMSPNAGRVLRPGLFDGYYAGYVDTVWNKYQSADLEVDTQAAWGVVTGRVDGNNMLTFSGLGSFAKPSAGDIFSCSTGPFAAQPENTAALLNIGARLAAAFNRSTLLLDTNQPDGERPDMYYVNSNVTNHYARVCHETSLDGRGYAFPYDDVGPSGGPDQSGSLSDGSPTLLTVTIA